MTRKRESRLVEEIERVQQIRAVLWRIVQLASSKAPHDVGLFIGECGEIERLATQPIRMPR